MTQKWACDVPIYQSRFIHPTWNYGLKMFPYSSSLVSTRLSRLKVRIIWSWRIIRGTVVLLLIERWKREEKISEEKEKDTRKTSKAIISKKQWHRNTVWRHNSVVQLTGDPLFYRNHLKLVVKLDTYGLLPCIPD